MLKNVFISWELKSIDKTGTDYNVAKSCYSFLRIHKICLSFYNNFIAFAKFPTQNKLPNWPPLICFFAWLLKVLFTNRAFEK